MRSSNFLQLNVDLLTDGKEVSCFLCSEGGVTSSLLRGTLRGGETRVYISTPSDRKHKCRAEVHECHKERCCFFHTLLSHQSGQSAWPSSSGQLFFACSAWAGLWCSGTCITQTPAVSEANSKNKKGSKVRPGDVVVCDEDGLDHSAPWVFPLDRGGSKVWRRSSEAVLVLLPACRALADAVCTSDSGVSGCRTKYIL